MLTFNFLDYYFRFFNIYSLLSTATSKRWDSTYSKWKIPFERGAIFPRKHPLYVNGQHHIQHSIHQQHDNDVEHGKVVIHRRPFVERGPLDTSTCSGKRGYCKFLKKFNIALFLISAIFSQFDTKQLNQGIR